MKKGGKKNEKRVVRCRYRDLRLRISRIQATGSLMPRVKFASRYKLHVAMNPSLKELVIAK